MKITKISHSRLQLFQQCSFHYRLKYEEELKSPLPEEPYFKFGHFLHKTFELVVKNKTDIETAAKEAQKKYSGFSPEYTKRIPNILTNFKTFQDSIYTEEFEKETTEHEFSIEQDGFIFNGIIDRKIFFKNGNLLILDYKTSKKRNQVSKYEINKDPQLMTYIWACSKLTEMPLESISGMLFYVDSGDKLLSRPDPRYISMHILNCVNIAKKIRNMNPENARANITKLCNYCEYRTVCPEFLKTK